MSKKYKMSRRKSKKLFTKTAMRHRKLNSANPVRGGIRL
uniref:DNA binding protein n=1 Tax=Dulem virus 149 TaxID=3145626 RepID=A0AAU8B1A5_9VIRU